MLYRYYQLVGGKETWTPVRANENIAHLKPTFETVLTLDTLLESDPDEETKERIKYNGPLYFDIDAVDIADSIESAQQLYSKLLSSGLTEHDIEIYVSGKKGFHLLVPSVCFMERPEEAQVKLPAIYKEIAFKMAVPFMDFAVYTAKRGRMLRTVYNQRENGLYKAAISADQLRSMTPESYTEAASRPTGKAETRAAFNARFSMVFIAAQQRVGAAKVKRSKPPSPEMLKRDVPIVNKILRGECQGGFNRIAIQLAIYAREVGWTEDQLVQSASTLIEVHESDGYRYNTQSKRAAEIRRMFQYVDDNSGYTYNSNSLRNLVSSPPPIPAPTKPAPVGEGETPAEGTTPAEVFDDADAEAKMATSDHHKVRVSLEGIFAEDGESIRQLSDVSLGNLSIAHVSNGEIASIQADVYVSAALVAREIIFLTDSFTGSASLHRELIRFGSGFWGSDTQARSVLAALMSTGAPAVTAVSHAGLDLVKLPNSKHRALQSGVLVWAGRTGCRAQAWAATLTDFVFTPDSAHSDVSDLMGAPHPSDRFVNPLQRKRMEDTFRALWNSNSESLLGQLYGWTTACFYKPLIQASFAQFPMLHVVGSAGYGKTANIKLALQMHTNLVELPEFTPTSSAFAFSQTLSCYSATPILLDEYKPHRLSETKLEQYRALLREAYNGKGSLRGGGGKVGAGAVAGNYRTLSATHSKAPIIFVAEAVETETAILERSVVATVTKRRGHPRSYENFRTVYTNRDLLSVLGRGIVEDILANETLERVSDELSEIRDRWAEDLRTPQKADSLDVARARRNIAERPLYNYAVVEFGLRKLFKAVGSILGDKVMEEFNPKLEEAVEGLKRLLLEASSSATPEIVKWLADISDLVRTSGGAAAAKLVTKDGLPYLMLQPRSLYSDYRAWARTRGTQIYYASPDSLMHALRAFDAYESSQSTSETVFLSYDACMEAGLPMWPIRAIAFKG